MADTSQHEVPSFFEMSCVAHLLGGEQAHAAFIISATSGYGLAACTEHRDVTDLVVARMSVDDDDQLRALFGRQGLTIQAPEEPDGS
ncbi:hypothetical protein [Streptomyces europaeiscabiei]|uniref:hypothetical protein n=1 Tax=Streptomyces europaeiscabiei TaxID=146819 RepID=UPI002E0D29D0|nr:hypothetical protein OHB30_33115 [Streptomyces europaeiscabiei]